MKMPLKEIEVIIFAPCGMNCKVCYKHCYSKKPCEGCLKSEEGKPEHCQKCKIKECIKEKSISYCYECPEYPCKPIRNLEKSYHIRYNTSLIGNSKFAKEKGLKAFMEYQKEKFTCSTCGGIISLHDSECSECKVKQKILNEELTEREEME